jgi:hypothetical protein
MRWDGDRLSRGAARALSPRSVVATRQEASLHGEWALRIASSMFNKKDARHLPQAIDTGYATEAT